MSLVSQLQTDFENVRADWTTTFTFGGTSYTGYLGEVSEENNLEPGGLIPDFSVELTIKAADFTTLPDIGDTVTITATHDTRLNSKVFRIHARALSDGKMVSYQMAGLNE